MTEWKDADYKTLCRYDGEEAGYDANLYRACFAVCAVRLQRHAGLDWRESIAYTALHISGGDYFEGYIDITRLDRHAFWESSNSGGRKVQSSGYVLDETLVSRLFYTWYGDYWDFTEDPYFGYRTTFQSAFRPGVAWEKYKVRPASWVYSGRLTEKEREAVVSYHLLVTEISAMVGLPAAEAALFSKHGIGDIGEISEKLGLSEEDALELGREVAEDAEKGDYHVAKMFEILIEFCKEGDAAEGRPRRSAPNNRREPSSGRQRRCDDRSDPLPVHQRSRPGRHEARAPPQRR